MNAKQVQQYLQVAFYETHPYQTLNFNRCGYQEADVFLINKNNQLVTEIEVKISLSDFKADFKKTFKHHKFQNYNDTHTCPSFFYYGCPAGLIPLSDIPTYAGLIYVNEDGSIDYQKKAPKIHKKAIEPKTLLAVLENLTAHRIFGCQWMTHQNRLSKAAHDRYEQECRERTARLIEFAKSKKAISSV
jgi:hypothetical protein